MISIITVYLSVSFLSFKKRYVTDNVRRNMKILYMTALVKMRLRD